MKHYALIGVAAMVAAAFVYGLLHDRSAAASPSADEAAIATSTDAYAKAFGKGDVERVLAVWAAEAEYIDEAGASTKGHAALAAMFKKALADSKGMKVQIKSNAIRIFNDVAWQDGTATLTQANGEVDSNPFTAVWTKKDGKWLLSLVREQPGQAADKEGAHPRLKELAWLAGDWLHEDKDVKTTLSAKFMKGDKFLALEWTVFHKGVETMALTQMIGWDPIGQQIHSWLFDARGGFGQGAWARKGSAWRVEASGTTGDGREGAGVNVWTPIGANTFQFQGIDREVGGHSLPDVTIVFQRVNKAK
jgi:uncharacterized protein (TIGR02246 family)